MYVLLTLVATVVITVLFMIFFMASGVEECITGESGIVAHLILFLVVAVVSFFISFMITFKFFDKYDFSGMYEFITTKQEFPIYDKIVKTPYGQETGVLPIDSVMEVEKVKRLKTLTWISGFVLVDGTPKYTTILIPAKVKLKENCEYFDFNGESASFSAYYQSIEDKNISISKKVRDEFSAELARNQIVAQYSTDISLKESIKDTHYILPYKRSSDEEYYLLHPEEFCFGLFIPEDSNGFFYINKKQKKLFNKLLKKYCKKYRKEHIRYFQEV